MSSLQRRSAARRFARALAIVAVCAGLGACADRDSPARDTPHSSASSSARRRPVDADLIAFLSKARAAHHSADLAESKGDLKLAIRHVEAIPNGPLPARGPELVEVVADAHSRIADLKSRIGAFDEAVRDVDRGLTWATETTHFRGHLYEVRGLVEERRMHHLEQRGDVDGAEKARKAALEAFDEAIEIQDEVITKLLPAEGVPASSAPPSPSP